jgi:prepilin-type N-terminal cleavage/methylation domain-containing protein
MKIQISPSSPRAFSLVELLVVIGVVAILSAIGAVAMRDGGQSVQSAANAASSLFSLARTEAILRRTEVRVVVDTNYQPSQPQNFLRRVGVAARREDGNWEMISRWTSLPGNAFFHRDLSASHGVEAMPGLGTGSLDYFAFRPNGQAAGPRSQFVVAGGEQNGGVFLEHGDNNRSGFFVHRLGRISFFQSPSEIAPL